MAGAASGADVFTDALLLEPGAREPLCAHGLRPQEPGPPPPQRYSRPWLEKHSSLVELSQCHEL